MFVQGRNMNLTFNAPHLSIRSLPSIDLPMFSVVTGLNGSGKTHLLQAILNGQVKCSVSSNVRDDVRLFDWNSIAPNNAEKYDSRGFSDLKFNAFNEFKALRNVHVATFTQNVTQRLGSQVPAASEILQLAKMSTDRYVVLFGDEKNAEGARKAVDEVLGTIWDQIENQIQQPARPAGRQLQIGVVRDLRRHHLRRLFELDEQDFSDSVAPTWGQAEPFRHAFSQLFVAYRDLVVENRLRRLALADGESSARPLSDREFVSKYNDPPWDFVNNALQGAALDFTIDIPPMNRFGTYKPILTKKSTGEEIEFANLSSGEKVLMAFAFSVYYAQDSRQLSSYPKLLLLDEVDAPLHPSMCRTLVRTITETLVAKHSIHVMLATHSPSTVALAPEESIYVMRANGQGLTKTTKGAALNVLTDGVPTVSLDFEGRRQVVVESAHDASLYERLYRCTKKALHSERSLEFIGVSRNPSENSGCSNVTHVVESLVKAGNKTIFGLIDWDGCNEPGDRIKVLAHGKRHSIENCIYDPLIVAILVSHEAPGFLPARGLPQVTGYLWFKNRTEAELQPIIDTIVATVFPGSASGSSAPLAYAGGFTLSAGSHYLKHRGHDLEDKLLDVFPPLKRNAGPAGKLMRFVVDTVIVDFPEYLPAEIAACFSQVLSETIM
jgi:energy-coupling factor transporter ATP-binding protein EcfA2